METVSSLAPSATRGHAFPDARRAHNSRTAEFDSGDFSVIDDLLDFSNDDIGGPIEVACPPAPPATSDVKLASCSWIDRKDSHATSIFDANGFGEFCVPCDDLAALEWLSNFVEESFSSGDVPADALEGTVRTKGFESEKTSRGGKEQYQRASPVSVLDNSAYSSGNVCMSSSNDMSIPARARTKRCRTPVCFWNTRIFSGDASASILESSSTSNMTAPDPQSSDSDAVTFGQSGVDSIPAKKQCKSSQSKASKKGLDAVPVRRCLHCSIQRTPQWRAGPMGPKTLCNACGVRYKSGRLLPEYRPAASPTFIESIHSNSHRRVLEMRRERADDFTTTYEKPDTSLEERVSTESLKIAEAQQSSAVI